MQSKWANVKQMNNLLREKGNGLQLRIRSFRCETEDFPFRLKLSFNFMQVNLTNRNEAILFLNIIWRVKCAFPFGFAEDHAS